MCKERFNESLENDFVKKTMLGQQGPDVSPKQHISMTHVVQTFTE